MDVAILGYGTVGAGVAEVIEKNGKQISRGGRVPLRLKYILDIRDFSSDPLADRFVQDFAAIENDPEVRIVAETIGGTGVAYEFTRRALSAGKSVVTSNKELVAAHGCELMGLAAEKGGSYLFEASVGGGIPILRPLRQCLAANEFSEVCGILNGTTNYILTRMIRAGLPFEAALQEAQENGYAERDPSADIEGHDACRKICILGSMAFGHHILPDQVPTQGISHLTLADADYGAGVGRKIKLLGRAIRGQDGRVRAYVAPHMVAGESPLSNVEDVFNAVMVRGDATGEVMFYGKGAGRLPTASAVVADMMDAARHESEPFVPVWEHSQAELVVSPDDIVSRWYARLRCGADTARALGAVEILSRSGAPMNETAFFTGAMSKTEFEGRFSAAQVLTAMRLLD